MSILTSGFEPVTVTKSKYDELIRSDERIAIIKRLVQKNNYIALGDLKSILDMPEEEKQTTSGTFETVSFEELPKED